MIIVVTIAMLACLAIGYLIGWIAHSDRADHARHEAAHPPAAAPRHAVTMPLRLKALAVPPDEWAGSYFPGPPAAVPQPPLGQLVRPGRSTDFIAKMKADTDRWIAANVGEAT